MIKKLFYRLLLYAYIANPKPRNFSTKCIGAVYAVTINAILIIADVVLIVRIIYPFKLPEGIPEYELIWANIGLACIVMMLLGFVGGKAEGLITAALAEKDSFTAFETLTAILCTYLPMVITLALIINQPVIH